MSKMNYGQALEAVKNGKLARRSGWNGKNMFIFMRPEDELSYDMVVQKVKSLPQSVKDYLYLKANDGDGNPIELQNMPPVKFTAYLCMRAADGSIVNGWLASQTDMISEDWEIIEEY